MHVPGPRRARAIAARFAVALTILAAGGCGVSSTTTIPGKPAVFVSLPPQKALVQRLAGARVRVEVLLRPGQSEHVLDPTPQQMTDLASARAYFAIGSAAEEALLKRIAASMPQLRVVDTSAGIARRALTAEELGEHEHDHADGEHHHHEEPGEPDPHIWLDPLLLKQQAANIADALAGMLPEHADEIRANAAKLDADLDAIHERIADALAPYMGRALFAVHPSFGYFTQRYGLRQMAIEVGGREPSPREAQRVIDRARAEHVRVIFTQPQFSRASAELIAREISGVVASVDPLDEDLLANLERIAAEFRRGMHGAARE